MTPRLAAGLIIVAIVAVLGALVLGGPIAGFLMDRWRDAEARVETQTDRTVAAEQTLQAERTLGRQALDLTVTIDAAQARTDQLKEEVHADPDAEEPLPGDSVDRLRRHDDWLCGQRPALCPDRGPAPGGDAGAGPGQL